MATSVRLTTTAQNKTAGTSISISPGVGILAGDVCVIFVTCDNTSATAPAISLTSPTGVGLMEAAQVYQQDSPVATSGGGLRGAIIVFRPAGDSVGGSVYTVTFGASITAKAIALVALDGSTVTKDVRNATVFQQGNAGSTTSAVGLGLSWSYTPNIDDVFCAMFAAEQAVVTTGAFNTTVDPLVPASGSGSSNIGTTGGSAVTNVNMCYKVAQAPNNLPSLQWSGSSNNGGQDMVCMALALTPVVVPALGSGQRVGVMAA